MTTRKMTHRCGFKPPNLRPGPALPFPDRCQRKQGRRKPKRSALRSAEGSATGTGGKRGRSGKWAIIYKKSRKKQMKVRRGESRKRLKNTRGTFTDPKNMKGTFADPSGNELRSHWELDIKEFWGSTVPGISNLVRGFLPKKESKTSCAGLGLTRKKMFSLPSIYKHNFALPTPLQVPGTSSWLNGTSRRGRWVLDPF